ncbi:hypothetical protein SNEBB_003191 [Seison nebaliae]|nr:hypothetical protein SNEBB_003191 [Seison nebaliae]
MTRLLPFRRNLIFSIRNLYLIFLPIKIFLTLLCSCVLVMSTGPASQKVTEVDEVKVLVNEEQFNELEKTKSIDKRARKKKGKGKGRAAEEETTTTTKKPKKKTDKDDGSNAIKFSATILIASALLSIYAF